MSKVKAGFSVKDISPEKAVPGRLGLNHMIEPYHPISAKAAAVETDSGTVLMIVCEIVGLTKSVNAAVREEIIRSTGLPWENIIITGTHTHASPWVWDLQDEEARQEGFAPLDRQWMSNVIKSTAAAGIEAVSSMNEYETRYGKALTDGIVSNRVDPVTRWSVCADDELRQAPAGVIDPYVRTMSFHDAGGDPVFIFTNLNVHPTAFGGGKTLKVSPDFPYIAEQKLRSKYNNDLVAAYWQGCGGNSNSGKYVKEGSDEEVQVIGERFAKAISEAVDNSSPLAGEIEFKYEKFTLPAGEFVKTVDDARKAFVDICNEIKAGKDDDETIFHWRKKLKQLDVSILSKDGGMEIELQLLRFMDTDYIFVPGEWYVQIYMNLAARLPGRKITLTTLNNFDLLYVPDEGSMPNTQWYGVRTGMRSLGNESAVRLYEKTLEFLD